MSCMGICRPAKSPWASLLHVVPEKVDSGIRPLKNKVEAIVNFCKPRTIEELRRFLGMVNFYRSHIPKAISCQAILNSYLHDSKKKDKTVIQWTQEADEALERCKFSLKNAVTFSHPLPNVPLALMADASNNAVLQQRASDKRFPLGYFSKTMSQSEQKYSAYDRDLLGIYILRLNIFRV